MLSAVKMSSITKERSSVFHGNAFTWKINGLKRNTKQSSDFFEFGGYCCFLCVELNVICGNLYYTISLHGYPTPYEKNVSCYYSIILKNDFGGACHAATGEIQTVGKSIDIVFLNEGLKYTFIDQGTVFFTWRGFGDFEVSSQGMQTESGYFFQRVINVIGQATQTEETTAKEHCRGSSPSRNVRTYAEIIKNVRGQATQTEGTQVSSARDVCNWLPFVSAEVTTNVLEQATQTEGTELLPPSDERNLADNIKRGTGTNTVESSTVDDTSIYEENEAFKFLEILSKDLGNFYESQTDPDCVLKVGETKFHVHRSVLAARSTVFGAMFHHDTSESQSGDVDIPDVDAGAFGDILYYVYTGKIRGLCADTATSMYVVSDKYSLIDFREKCLSFLKNNLTMKNVCDAALLANAHSETELDNKIVQFIEENLEEITENDNWEKFSETHYKLANKLLCSACKISKNKLMKKPFII